MQETTITMLEELKRMKFTLEKKAVTPMGQTVLLSSAKLPIEKDCANVIIAVDETSGTYLVGTEQGVVIRLNIHKNRVLGAIKAKRWISGISYFQGDFWTVGEDKIVSCYSEVSNKEIFSIKENKVFQNFSDSGIVLREAHNKNCVLYNSGLLRFKLVNRATKKIMRSFDLAKHLEHKKGFKSFTQPSRVVRTFVTSKFTPHVILLINRNHPHIIIVNFKTFEVVLYEELRGPLDRSFEKPISMNIIGNNDDLFVAIFQTENTLKSRIETCYVSYMRERTVGNWGKTNEGFLSSRFC